MYFNDTLQAQIVLLEFMIEINKPIDPDTQFGANMIVPVCTFDLLIDSQRLQLQTLLTNYLDNDWLALSDFQCWKL